MKKFIVVLLLLLLNMNVSVFAVNFDINDMMKFRKTAIPAIEDAYESPTYWKKLRTTYVPGIYCQQVADDGTYRNQKHYFYNKKTQKMVLIPDLYFISDPSQLGPLMDEYEKYGEKSDTIKHKGKTYKIWTMP